MSLAIFGAGNKNNPGNKIIGGSSRPREREMFDTKLSSRKAKNDMKTVNFRNDTNKEIRGRVLL